MIKKVGLCFLFLIVILSCTSTGFLGLAKESYVQQLEQENNQLKQDFGIVKKDMETVLELADEIEELEVLTKGIESRLDELPEETLRKLVDILSEYLSRNERENEIKPDNDLHDTDDSVDSVDSVDDTVE
jgi:hypothetical protein